MKRYAMVGALGLALMAGTAGTLEAQGLTYSRGQSVSPAFEGWWENPDGTFSLVFGYMNRNWVEQPNAPVGADNFFSPGQGDRGQPTNFLPRRNRFVFEVIVPADFGDDELNWTLRVHGEEKVAIGSLRSDYFMDNVVIMSETGALGAGSSNPELRAQQPPTVTLQSPKEIDARVGQPVRLSALVEDDGLPRGRRGNPPITDEGLLDYARAGNPPGRITVGKVNALYLTWFVYRAPADVNAQEVVSFDRPQVHYWEDTRPYSNSPYAPGWIPPELPADGVWITEVTFDEPGTYILRARADDGGLYTDEEVTIRVRGVVS
jgi:hypothetical protein